jgi:Protein of unknown function (DUF2924)
MATDVSGQIAQLPGLSRQRLLDLWLKLYGRAAPPGIRRELMVPFLAYRIQERAYGGLNPGTRSKLLRNGKTYSTRARVIIFASFAAVSPLPYSIRFQHS